MPAVPAPWISTASQRIRPPRRGRVARLVGAVGAAGLLAAAGLSAPAAATPTPAVGASIGSRPVSRPVPPGYIGLSIEYPSALAYFGTDPANPDSVFMQLVRNLTPGQSPVLRFGGDTTDWTWWDTPGVRRPLGIRYTLGPVWVNATAAMARALDARLILGINLEADSSAIARTEADQLVAGIGPQYVAALELGNEPEVYGGLGWYTTKAGVSVLGRRRGYDFAAYLRDDARVLHALPAGVPIAGPASGSTRWLEGLSRYLVVNPRVQLATFHRYPLNRCFTARSSPHYPTIANLLSPAASAGLADTLRAAVITAHARGVPLRADELNSVSCGGARGVSDTFASALWVLDTLFNMVRVGVDGVNIHTFQKAIYEPFAIEQSDGVWQAQVRPLYYGLLMFAKAAPPGSRLLAVSAPTTAPPTLRLWAVRKPLGGVSVVLINESPRRRVTVSVRAPTPAAVAAGIALRGPGAAATSGVTLGGQSFATTTTTGRITGPTGGFRLTAMRGRFVVRLAPMSATLLTVPAH